MGRMKSTGMPLYHERSSSAPSKCPVTFARTKEQHGLGGRGGSAHGLVSKAQEEVCVRAQVARLEVRVLGCEAVDLERDGEVVIVPQVVDFLHCLGNQLAEEDRPRVRELRCVVSAGIICVIVLVSFSLRPWTLMPFSQGADRLRMARMRESVTGKDLPSTSYGRTRRVASCPT